MHQLWLAHWEDLLPRLVHLRLGVISARQQGKELNNIFSIIDNFDAI